MTSSNTPTRKKSLLAIAALCISIFFTMQSCVTDDSVNPTAQEPESLQVLLGAHWTMDGHANDASKYHNDGAVRGAVPTKDRFGRSGMAFSFDGMDDYIDFGNITYLSWGGYEPYTMAAWVKPGENGGSVVSKFNGGVSAGWYMDVKSDLHVSTYRNVVPWATASADAMEIGEWYHLVAMYDGRDLYIYINGELQQQQYFRSQPQDFETNVLVGARFSQNYPANFFNGSIDDVRLYTRTLDMEEIQWLAKH